MFTLQDTAPISNPILMITPEPDSTITMAAGNREILRITNDGFYVRGARVPADKKESAAVYRAFKQWLVEHALTRN